MRTEGRKDGETTTRKPIVPLPVVWGTKKKKLYTSNIEDIEQMLDDNEQNGLPEHIWAQVAPGTEHMDRQDRNQPLEININIENEDLVANAVMFENQTCHPTSDVALRYDK